MSVVGATLTGNHSLRRNNECDQVYYVVNGTGSVVVDGQRNELSPGDAVFIASGSTHAVDGDLELLIINGPAFDFNQTEVLE